jgi:CspA family cold shock protein
MARGTVKWFNERKGYGFISAEGSQDVFVHFAAIEGRGFRTLNEGEEVEFDIKNGARGTEAEHVVRKD